MRKVWFISAVIVASFFATAFPVAAGPGDAPEESGNPSLHLHLHLQMGG